jgi:hypothetical protein
MFLWYKPQNPLYDFMIQALESFTSIKYVYYLTWLINVMGEVIDRVMQRVATPKQLFPGFKFFI